MILLHNIGVSPSSDPRIASNYNTREEILACNEPLSFDGIYKNVYDNMDVLEGKDVTFFIVGDLVGKDNTFDAGMPYEEYCTWDQIMEMVKHYKIKLGWHSWSHRDLSKIVYSEVIKEVTPPFPMTDFAYPYGNFDSDTKRALRQLGYERGWSVTQGDGTDLALKRQYLNH